MHNLRGKNKIEKISRVIFHGSGSQILDANLNRYASEKKRFNGSTLLGETIDFLFGDVASQVTRLFLQIGDVAENHKKWIRILEKVIYTA